MIDIKLNYNYGFEWYSSRDIYVKGYIFDEDNNLYKGEKLVEYFQNIFQSNDFEKKLLKANGMFSVVIKLDNLVMAAVDRTRTFPIFYYSDKGDIFISDDTYYLKKLTDSEIDESSSLNYLASGYVPARKTLLKNIYQIKPSEYIYTNNAYLKFNSYYNYIPEKIFKESYGELTTKFLAILDNVTERLIDNANGCQIVIPLSGGYDSRLLACMLKKYNYDNVLCFTFGNIDSFEVDISEQVATALGFKWKFIEYTEETIPINFVRDVDFLEFAKYTSNYSSKMVTQDYFAVKYLFDNNYLTDNAIFVPGYSGDFLGGSQVAEDQDYSRQTVARIIKDNYHNLDTSKSQKEVDKIVKVYMDKHINIDSDIVYSLIDNYILNEKLSKHIVNAIRNYEIFSFKSALPFYDLELLDFFKELPLKYKNGSYFYRDILFNKIFKKYNVNILQPEVKDNLFRKMIRYVLPVSFLNYIRSKRYKDINNVNLQSIAFLGELNEDVHYSKSNEIIAKWYLKKIQKK